MPIAKIQLPNGQIGRFEVPEGMSQQEIEAHISQMIVQPAGGEQQAPEQKPVDDGFSARVSKRYDERVANAEKIADFYVSENQTKPETYLQFAGQGAGLASDIVGEGLKSMGRGLSAVTPDFIEQPIKEAGKDVLNYVVDSPVGDAARYAATKYNDFAQEYPRAARNVEATVNIGAGILPLARIKGKSIADSAVSLAEEGAKPLVKIAQAGLKELNKKAIIPGADEVRQMASNLYKRADEVGGLLKPEFTNKFVDSVAAMQPQTAIGKAFKGNDVLADLNTRLASIRNKPMTLQAAQEADEALGDAISSLVDNGKLTKEGQKLFEVQTTLRNQIENATPDLIAGGKEGFAALKEARRLWSVSRRMADVERIIQNAEMFQVPATAIKTGFRNIVKNPNRIRGYSPREIKAMERAAKTGVVTDVLNVFGSRLGALIAAGGGYASGGLLGGLAAGAVSHAASSAARKTASSFQKKRAEAALKEIAKQSGLVRQGERIPTNALADTLLKLKKAD